MGNNLLEKYRLANLTQQTKSKVTNYNKTNEDIPSGKERIPHR